jgi:xanthine dehydrogenase molybdenum-binding subunit
MPEYSVVGQRVPRSDARDKVTGRAVFSADVNLPGMLYGRVLRSPYAHARILRLDVSRARALEGVMAIVTAADVPGQKSEYELGFLRVAVLAREKAIFAGHPVAAVAAVNPNIAEEALGLIEVDYEELPLVMDALEAMKPGAPLVHPNLHANLNVGNNPEKATTPGNISWRFEYGRGDVEAGFAEADFVLEDTFHTQRVHHGYLETRSSVASVDLDGKVTVWTDNQGLFIAREAIAGFLALPLNHVRVVPVEVGGAFGGKSPQFLAPLCALLSQKTGRPVRMGMTRAEDFVATNPAPASSITLKMGVTRDGRLTSASATFIFDNGAYTAPMPQSIAGSMTGLGLYRIPNLKVVCYDVLTNKAPSGFYRGPSAPQGAFAVESEMDLIARALKMDPLELRLRNAVAEGDPGATGTPFPRIGFRETLERMREYLAQRGRLEGENRGRGVACGFWRGGVGNSAAHVNVNADGTVTAVVGSTDLTGTRTSLAQMVAEEFGIPFDRVTVATGDTETAPYSDISAGSRTTHQMGTAVCRACQDAKDQLLRRGAQQLKVAPNDVEFVRGHVQMKGAPEKSVAMVDLARASVTSAGEGPITGRGSVGMPQPVPMFAVQVADVEVDRETGKVKLLSFAAAQDVGLAVNPLLVEGQMQGAVAQGIGWALYEDYVFQNGVMQNPNLLDYRMLTAADLPFIETLMVEVDSATGPFGVRGVGEPPIVPCLAVMANAIHSATGVRLKELPMNPEAVFWALRAQEKT